MVRATQYGRRPSSPVAKVGNNLGQPNRILKNGERDWYTQCEKCGGIPTVHPSKLCEFHRKPPDQS